MLGAEIIDDAGIEGPPSRVKGLGLLDVVTVMTEDKHLTETTATHLATGAQVNGYEIHIGRTTGPDTTRAWLEIQGRGEGATSPDGRIQGCYLHGLFNADEFRTGFLTALGTAPTEQNYSASVDATLDALADHLETHMDVETILSLAAKV